MLTYHYPHPISLKNLRELLPHFNYVMDEHFKLCFMEEEHHPQLLLHSFKAFTIPYGCPISVICK